MIRVRREKKLYLFFRLSSRAEWRKKVVEPLASTFVLLVPRDWTRENFRSEYLIKKEILEGFRRA